MQANCQRENPVRINIRNHHRIEGGITHENHSNHLENQLAKTKAEKTGEKIRAFAEESKIELSPELLEAINGGMDQIYLDRIRTCERCGSPNIKYYLAEPGTWYGWAVKCNDCGWSKI